MRKIFLILIFVATSLFAELNWADDYKSALQQAKKENKKVMVMFSAEDCSKCEKMQKEVYTDKAVSRYANSKFVSVEIDFEYDKREGYKVYSAPTFYFLDSDGQQIGKAMVGDADAKTFLEKLQEIEQSK